MAGTAPSALTTAKPIKWVKLTLAPVVRNNWLLTMVRLTSSSLAGTTRTLVAVGTPSDASMLDTIRAAAPRRGAATSASSAWVDSVGRGGWVGWIGDTVPAAAGAAGAAAGAASVSGVEGTAVVAPWPSTGVGTVGSVGCDRAGGIDGTGLGPAKGSVSPFRAGKTSAPDRNPSAAWAVAVAGGREGEGEDRVIVELRAVGSAPSSDTPRALSDVGPVVGTAGR